MHQLQILNKSVVYYLFHWKQKCVKITTLLFVHQLQVGNWKEEINYVLKQEFEIIIKNNYALYLRIGKKHNDRELQI